MSSQGMGIWNEQSAAEATAGEARGLWYASRVEIDSRKVQLGDLFVAIKGERVDGHHYVADALARGAVAAVVSHVPEGLPRGASLVVVNDTLAALADMARYNRARSKAKIVGVTGSVGKTSTKEMLRLALAAHGKTFATSGNFNNHIGTPLNLANLPLDAAYGVFEMGMNHGGEIAYLSEMVRPHVALVTTIEAVHLEHFKNMDGIADAKAEIFDGMEVGGIAVLNADSQYCDYVKQKAQAAGVARILTCGESAAADARLLAYDATKGGAEITGSLAGQTISFAIGATGKHFATTAMAVLAVAHALALPLPKTAAALVDYKEVDGRGKTVKLTLPQGNAWLIDDSYNASPASMRAAISKTDEVWKLVGGKGRKIAALGDMLELGTEAPAMHAALSEALIRHGVHLVFTAGSLMQHLSTALPKELRGGHMQTAQQLIPLLQKTLASDDVLLVKGSHGSNMAEVTKALLAASQPEKKHAV